jgi:glycogen debranching enzyme
MPAKAEQLVLKEGDVFFVSSENGDVPVNSGLGLYYHDMRYLSLLEFRVNGQMPELLNFSSSQNFMGILQFANELFHLEDGTVVMPQTISIRRSRFISEGLHERLGFVNYNRFPVPMTLSVRYGADFRDIFDVRGFPRDNWGHLLEPEYQDGTLRLSYKGIDDVTYTTQVTFDHDPDWVDIQRPEHESPKVEMGIMVPVVGAPSYHILIDPPTAVAHWHMVLQPNTPTHIAVHVMPFSEAAGPPGETEIVEAEQLPQHATPPPSPLPTISPVDEGGTNARYDRSVNRMRFSYWSWETLSSRLYTDHEEFNVLLRRSVTDLRVLSAVQGDAFFPSAGIPWYACPFGRDAIITALQTMMLNPQIAVGTLRVLAKYQGTKIDEWREEQPGKILHEMRRGEMARLGMVPHSPYYGTVDATPLFVMLFVETMRWLDDDMLYKELLPNVMRAIEWIDKYGDVDKDGFVEYVASSTHTGIRNQVWKDSGDSIQFPDGTLAETPIAAVEVQGYVYAARKGLGELLKRKGQARKGERLIAQAQELKAKFNEAFWMPDAGFYTQGLDKDKRQVPTITTNPGHALWTGIADPDKARQAANRMMEPDMLSGWGLRTISSESPSYNPMSYHNGSVWPHDNSLVAQGLKMYGQTEEALTVITQMAEAAQHFRYARLPELYCGFPRDKIYNSGPSEYPVSCSPQAWAAGASILMLQAILGLQADDASQRVRMSPRLPDWLYSVRVSNLRVGKRRIDLRVERHEGRDQVFMSGDTGVALEIV